nr:hypothetical protein Q903MT_gene2081 [Picea sitchensis]
MPRCFLPFLREQASNTRQRNNRSVCIRNWIHCVSSGTSYKLQCVKHLSSVQNRTINYAHPMKVWNPESASKLYFPPLRGCGYDLRVVTRPEAQASLQKEPP